MQRCAGVYVKNIELNGCSRMQGNNKEVLNFLQECGSFEDVVTFLRADVEYCSASYSASNMPQNKAAFLERRYALLDCIDMIEAVLISQRK